jgi:hypothetical protein
MIQRGRILETDVTKLDLCHAFSCPAGIIVSSGSHVIPLSTRRFEF